MRLLALDTLGPALSAALVASGRETACRVALPLEGGGQAAERLLPLLDEILAEAGWGWRDLDLLAVTVGPGGFTAVRTGVATARALALALDRPAVGVGTLEAVAEAAVAAAGSGPLLALKDLRRGDVAAQAFGDDLVPEGVARLLDRAAALEAAAGAGRLAGDGAATIACDLPAPPSGPVVVEAAFDARYVAAAALRRVARGEEPVAGTSLRPFYLRAPDARADAGRPLVTPAVPR